MRRIAEVFSLGGLLLLAVCSQSVAEAWPPWADEAFGMRPDLDRRRDVPEDVPERAAPSPDARAGGGAIRHGGARPEIAPVAPPRVAFPHAFPASSIVIDAGARKLYFVLPDKHAYEYPISVGREGFNWTGTETVSRKQAWPDWYPPAEMRERDAALPEKMTGGLKNPLGAMALYLGTSLYRIHGTNDVASIGNAQSSGCFRMLNSAVVHLASITEIGTTVTVVASLPDAQAEIVRTPEPPVQPPISPKGPPPAATTDREVLLRERATDFRTLRERTIEQALGKR